MIGVQVLGHAVNLCSEILMFTNILGITILNVVSRSYHALEHLEIPNIRSPLKRMSSSSLEDHKEFITQPEICSL